jgi:hypothetical protein
MGKTAPPEVVGGFQAEANFGDGVFSFRLGGGRAGSLKISSSISPRRGSPL